MNKLSSLTKKLLTICGFVFLFTIIYIFINFFVLKPMFENSEEPLAALGLLLLSIYFSIPCIFLEIGLSIFAFIFAKNVKKAIQENAKIKLVKPISFLVLTSVSGVLLVLHTFMFDVFLPVFLLLAVVQIGIAILALIYVVKNKKANVATEIVKETQTDLEPQAPIDSQDNNGDKVD